MGSVRLSFTETNLLAKYWPPMCVCALSLDYNAVAVKLHPIMAGSISQCHSDKVVIGQANRPAAERVQAHKPARAAMPPPRAHVLCRPGLHPNHHLNRTRASDAHRTVTGLTAVALTGEPICHSPSRAETFAVSRGTYAKSRCDFAGTRHFLALIASFVHAFTYARCNTAHGIRTGRLWSKGKHMHTWRGPNKGGRGKEQVCVPRHILRCSLAIDHCH